MKQQLSWAVIALTMAMGTLNTACSSDNDEADEPVICPVDNDRHDISLTRSEEQLICGSNDFAFRLLKASAKEEESIILSPLSITYALGMLNNGATGETQQQIEQTLGFGSTGADEINNFCQKMLFEASQMDQLTKVMIANTIYMNKGYELKSDFKKKAKTYYDAEPETRDFYDGKTLGVINQWASDHTEKMITKVLDEETFEPDAVSYLLNALYFKGVWTNKFDKSMTRDEKFNTGGTQTTVAMMHQEDKFTYTETDDYQALCLPYGNQSYEMTILLPKGKVTPIELAAKMDDESWKFLKGRMITCKVNVKLPRFESKTDLKLNKIMAALGMPRAFTGMAEFDNFCNTSTYIELMKQVARIKLDEEGTEAAAVTVIGMEKNAMVDEPKVVNFIADHPFLYVISEQSTGAIFFIGTYNG